MKSFSEFLLEKKLFIFQRKFRIDDLVKSNIYPISDIVRWMDTYKFDKLAHAMLVSKEQLSVKNVLTTDDIRVSSRDIKNSNYFNDTTKGYDGYLIDESMIELGNDIVYLYVFRKNSNSNNRARQVHGFKYEGEIKRLNNLKKLPYVDKWDAKGTLDKSFLDKRLSDNKKVEFFNGENYISLINKDSNGVEEIDTTNLPDSYRKNMFWNIKCINNGKSIEMGDFKRISGLKTIDNEVSLKGDNSLRFFMLNIGLHDTNNNVVEEYFIFMPIRKWKEYLPDLTNPEVIKDVKSMYKELNLHKLKGDRTETSEKYWREYTSKYSKLTKDKVIKLRFKRDSKGQLRIQSSINYNDFVNTILKNPHIVIY